MEGPRLRRLTTLATLCATLATGCSSSYRPRPGPRVAMIIDEGQPALAHDGQVTSIGLFGDGLEEVVASNPRAREHAETFFNYTVGGFVVGLLGAGATGAGAGMLIANEAGSEQTSIRVASFGLMFGGLALGLTGAFLQLAAQPHFFDAINIYNDEVDPGFGMPADFPPTPLPIMTVPPPPPVLPPPPPVEVAPPPPPVPPPDAPPSPEPEPAPSPDDPP
ncbi:MAG: hypothetical protein KC731_35115 [Myxococcales bacterium]|nr:hypothetical protein [Myxococcales bacterium]